MMDRDTVVRAQCGDADAFARIANAHGDGLFALAHRILRDVDGADDALQQTLVTAWRELPRLRDPDRLESWLRQILVRTCYAEGRRSRLAARAVRSTAVESVIDGGQHEIDDRDRLERGFRRLPADQRAILAMHHYLGLSPTEIAETLGIPPGTARSRLHYAHEAMRAALEALERGVVAGGQAR